MVKKAIIFLSIFIFCVNIPIINKPILEYIDKDHFKYSNADASFTYKEDFGFKSPYLNKIATERFIIENNPNENNKELFRLYKINPLCFWRWSYYLIVSINYKYHNWKDIELNRTPKMEDNIWQSF